MGAEDQRQTTGPSGYYPPPAGYPPPPAGYPQQQYAGYQQPPPTGYQQPPPQAYYYAQQQPQPQQYKPQQPGRFGVQAPGYDMEAAAAAAAAAGFAQQAVRQAFTRKVLLLVLLQVAFTTGIACVFMFVKPVKNYVSSSSGQWVFIVAWVLALVMIIALACSTTLRRRWPYNMLALFGFTAVMSVLVGSICAYGDVQIVLIAFITTAGIVAGITLLAFTIPFDLTKRGHILAAAAMIFFMMMLITIIVGFFYVSKVWYLVISAIGAVLFSAFLLYDLQMVIGGKTYECSPDEYVFASVQIYLDIINIFLMVLSIGNLASS